MIAARLMLVTDRAFGDDTIVRCVEQVARALPRGALCVQLRDKERGPASLGMMAWRLRVVTRALGAALVVNGTATLARDVGAEGVHLGGGTGNVGAARRVLGSRRWVSVTAHSDEDVQRAAADGADAVVVSPIFASRPPGVGTVTKEGRGVDVLRRARALSGGAAVFALGGVDRENSRACGAAGAHGVAVMKALLASPSPGTVARAIHDAIAPRW
jgi:thiamine-phosphate pyrophosphorylase